MQCRRNNHCGDKQNLLLEVDVPVISYLNGDEKSQQNQKPTVRSKLIMIITNNTNDHLIEKVPKTRKIE